MTLKGFVKRWHDVILWVIATISFAFTTFEFTQKYIYVRDDLQATVIGEVDELLPPARKSRMRPLVRG